MPPPLACLITFSCYGSWLHGRSPGSVDRRQNVPGTPFIAPDEELEQRRRHAMAQPAYILDAPRRAVVLQTIREVCAHRGWELYAAHVRTTHVHVVAAAPEAPEKVMSDLKAWSSRRLREAFREAAARKRWTQHGSTRYLHCPKSLEAALSYVVEEQGEPMAVHDPRNHDYCQQANDNEPEA